MPRHWKRAKRKKAKQLQRQRSEQCERTFAHMCDTGGARRTWLRGIDNVRKRYLITAAAKNLGLIMRTLLGKGTPRGMGAIAGVSMLA